MPPVRNLVFRFIVVLGGLFVATLTFTLDRGLPLTVADLRRLRGHRRHRAAAHPFGRHVFAVGGNIEAARAGRHQGAAGAPVGLHPLLDAGRRRRDPARGLTTSVNPAPVGHRIPVRHRRRRHRRDALFGGRGSAWSALLGALVIGSIVNGMALLSKPSDVRFIVTGVGADRRRDDRRARPPRSSQRRPRLTPRLGSRVSRAVGVPATRSECHVDGGVRAIGRSARGRCECVAYPSARRTPSAI